MSIKHRERAIAASVSEQAAPVFEYRFTVRFAENDSSAHGVFTKRVDAKSPDDAWIKVVKELKTMNMLKTVVSITKG